jgi:ABC-type uncharacterized transport system involved in gliding motility auxiliary subunit
MATRNRKIVTLSRTSSLLLLGVLVLLNAVFARASVRLDLTEEGIYTLAEGSKRILGALQDPATLKVFWHDVPEDWESQRRHLANLLEEMKVAARGRLVVRWVDLTDETGKREADEAGVKPHPFTVQGEGEVRQKLGYDSLAIETGDERKVVPSVNNAGPQLEYEIVSTLHKMAGAESTVVGLMVPTPAFNPFSRSHQGRFRALPEFLGAPSQFGSNVRTTVTLAEPVAPDIRVLLVVAPSNLTADHLYHLEQFVLRGGKLLLYLDPVNAEVIESPGSRPATSGLEDWLGHLGVTVASGVVADFRYFQHAPVSREFQGMRLTELLEYPYWPVLVGDGLDASNPATRGWQIPLYWPAPLAVDLEKQAAAGRRVTILGQTSEFGYRRPDIIGLSLDIRPPDRSELGRVPVMVLLEGRFESYWKGRPAPGDPVPEPPEGDEEGEEAAPAGNGAPAEGDGEGEGEGLDGPPAPPRGSEGEEAGGEEPREDEGEAPDASRPPRLEEGEGMVIVLGDGELVDDNAVYLARFRPGYDNGFPFTQSLLEWMGGNEDLLTLRARARKPRLITDTDAAQKRLISWANVLAVPLLILFSGLVVFIVRTFQR